MENSLYSEIVAAGIPYGNHYFDLYFKKTPQSMAILEKYPLNHKNAEEFLNRITKERWIDVPFAYCPYWEEKESNQQSTIEMEREAYTD